ncbi:hypothetical protein [Acinetobacter sp. WCHAc060025]|uniref:hypothetical protein n=1 Tax=Acinetobacter sp. WCHAc060025 TaxID=2518625 RepID=UPI001022AE53|nr:hypothetical protein [Acinetobacter sp. WCHAc060025]RZG72444.1 hypothetical protein EXE09_17140 [Acinetobacter sp. WCHAc060025]
MNAQAQIAHSNQSVGLLNLEAFELSQRIAKMLSSSTLVPEQYRATIQKKAGKDQYGNQQWREEPNPNGLPNCIIALNMSNRMGADPLMIMQNLYIVNGRPSWSSQYIMAGINSSGRFSALRFEIEDLGEKEVEYSETTWENRQKKTVTKTLKVHDFSCVAWAFEKETGERLDSSKITIEMAVKEGWYTKEGSKWQTMSEQMLRYRAASFFGRVYAPELLMGLRSAEEEQDRMIDVTPVQEATIVNASDFKHIKSLILKARSLEALEELESSIYALSDESERNELIKLYKATADKYKVTDVDTTDSTEATESKKPEPEKEDAPPPAEEAPVAEVTQERKPTSTEIRKEMLVRIQTFTNVSDLKAIIPHVHANDDLTDGHKAYVLSSIEQKIQELEAKAKPAVNEIKSSNIKGGLIGQIQEAKDVTELENIAQRITENKAQMTPEHQQETLTAYAQRKEILSQADIFDEPTPVERAIARINKCQTQDEINQVWGEIENDPYLSRALTLENKKQIEAAADRREAEIQG